jgi:hypothetical protein
LLNKLDENFFVRQILVKIWEAWNVTMTILPAPTLIELATTFFSSIVALLWTHSYEFVVVMRAFVLLFLVLAVVLIMLPVVSRRSLYKSPAAWEVAQDLEMLVFAADTYKRCHRHFLTVIPHISVFGTTEVIGASVPEGAKLGKIPQ